MAKMNWGRVRNENRFSKWRQDNPDEYRVWLDAKQHGIDASNPHPPKNAVKARSVKRGRLWTQCPVCGCNLKKQHLVRHLAHVHGVEKEADQADIIPRPANQVTPDTKLGQPVQSRCPVCDHVQTVLPGIWTDCAECHESIRFV